MKEMKCCKYGIALAHKYYTMLESENALAYFAAASQSFVRGAIDFLLIDFERKRTDK